MTILTFIRGFIRFFNYFCMAYTLLLSVIYLIQVVAALFKVRRQAKGKMKQLSIVKYPSGKYYVNIVCEIEIEEKQNQFNEVGIDLGIKDLLVLSDGKRYQSHKLILKYEKQLAKAQQHLSRKQKGSNNYENQRIKVAKIQEKIANCRNDLLHKITHELTNTYSDVFLEDLNVKGMQKNKYLAKSLVDCS